MNLDDLRKTTNVYNTFTYGNGDQEYKRDMYDVYYLVRNNVVIAIGDQVWSYLNNDYAYHDFDDREYLYRENKLLFVTEPKQIIVQRGPVGKTGYKYEVRDLKSWKIIKKLSFPFKTSILDVVDNKLKGEL